MKPKDPYKVPKPMQELYNVISALTDQFCKEYLNEEYADLSRKAVAALARKRPSPLVSGRTNTWACGVVYALGQANFLFDKSQDPHIRADDLCEIFGISKSTGGNKAKQIRDLLKIDYFSHEWMLPSRQASSSMAWLITVDGFMVDARQLPRHLQEIAYEKGLIPYIPGGE